MWYHFLMGDFFKNFWHHIVPSEHNSYRPHLLRPSWLGFFLAIILAAEGFLVTNLVVRQSSENFLAAVVPGEIIALINVQRGQNDVGALQENSYLDAAAQAKAEDMAAQGYFSHIGPNGKTPWAWIEGAGYTYQYAGENLAVRFVDSTDVINAWMASPTHRANIVKGVYTDTGVGVAQGIYQGQPATFVVQYFGSPASVAAVAQAPPESTTAVNTSVAQKASKAVGQTTTSASSTLASNSVPNGVPPASQVLGAQTTPGPNTAAGVSAPIKAQSLSQMVVRAFAHIQAEPLLVTEWVLGTIAAILGILLFLVFFVHIQIQPTQMLMTGTTLVVFTLFLMYCNSSFLTGAASNSNQSASVSQGIDGARGVVIDPVAAATQH